MVSLRSIAGDFSSSSKLAFQISKEESGMSETSTLIGYGGRTIGREELTLVPTPAATEIDSFSM